MSRGAKVRGRQAPWRAWLLSTTTLAVGVLIVAATFMAMGCSSNSSAPETVGLASDEMYALAGDLIEAMNSTDVDKVASLYAEDAIFEDFLLRDKFEGRDEIVDFVVNMADAGAMFKLSGKPIQIGDYLVQPVSFMAEGEQVAQGVHVFLINEDDLVTHQWVSGRMTLSE
jgi:hypothetical protein